MFKRGIAIAYETIGKVADNFLGLIVRQDRKSNKFRAVKITQNGYSLMAKSKISANTAAFHLPTNLKILKKDQDIWVEMDGGRYWD